MPPALEDEVRSRNRDVQTPIVEAPPPERAVLDRLILIGGECRIHRLKSFSLVCRNYTFYNLLR